MSKKIANLNLNQSLEECKVGITKLLKIDNVTEWTGITIKEREEKIYYLLDFYHATEHLQSFAEASFNDKK